jgi:hypothetical protein
MTMTTIDRNARMIECAHELLARCETTLAGIYCREVRSNDEDMWTLQGLRLALIWVLSYAPVEGD